MTALPEGRAGRILALSILALLLALAWLLVGDPLTGWYADRAAALQQRHLIAERMTQLVANLPALRRAAQEGNQGPGAGTLVAGASDAVAGAALQQRVQDMAQSVGADLSSIEALPAARVGAYRRIGVRVALHATWPVVLRLMQAAETSSPHMLVDDVQLHGPRIAGAAAEPALDGTLVIYGFRSGEAT
jgi:general secretion pathway protein M